MPPVKEIFSKYPNKFFLETGTCLGEGLEIAVSTDCFQCLISIELSLELFLKAKKKFNEYKNVAIFLGDSAELLQELLKSINAPVTFWLDAHFSGGTTGNEYITAHNNKMKDVVLCELEAIKNHTIKTHTILIDDANFFEHLPLKDILLEINPNYMINRDGNILIATL